MFGGVTSYKLNDGEWTLLTSSMQAIPVSDGDEVQFKNSFKTFSFAPGTSVITATTQYNIKGNIMSLGEGDDFENATSVPVYGFYQNFFGGQTNLISAENLCLPATTLTDHCYENMFNGCTSLVAGPSILPAEVLTTYCYASMFAGCTSLVTAPQLPATTLATYCYNGMFNGCSSLEEIPELPATTVAAYSYGRMFEGCTSLEQVELPAFTTLGNYCFNSMFSGCTSLSYIKCTMEIPYSTWSSLHAFDTFFSGLPSNGTFVKSSNAPTIAETQGQPGYVWPIGNYGYSIPPTWTIVNAQ